MSDPSLLIERLEALAAALERIPQRMATIQQPEDFRASSAGIEHMDSICMVLIAAGEELKKIDRQTNGNLLANYPQVPWRGVIGLRDVLAHGYFDVDHEQLFVICIQHVPELIATLRKIIEDLSHESTQSH